MTDADHGCATIEWHDGAMTQWCHGAPGIVASLDALPPDPELARPSLREASSPGGPRRS
ncbi:MAG: hypothetical protein LH654_09950 [Thermoleophilia bacterium]|nr:hypothetical protein [Thermoleophilia bacterium]